MKIFVYGTLKEGYGNHHLLDGAVRLPGLFVTCGKFDMYDGSFPIVAAGKGGRVVGEIYLVADRKQVSRLDRLEGHPQWYVRGPYSFTGLNDDMSPGHTLHAQMYVMPLARVDAKNRQLVKTDRHGLLEWKRQ